MNRVSTLAPLLVYVAAVPIFLLTLSGGSGAESPTGSCATITMPGGEQVGDTHLDAEQMQVATEAVRAVRAFGPTADEPHAAVIVLAAGYQESRLRNLDSGDRDSLGFLQQRPSQGWGTPAQVRDVTYATTTFVRHLVQIPNWETRRVTEVAADVQHPAEEYRGLYEQWVPLATELVERLWATGGTTTSGSVRLHHANLYVGEGPAQFREDLGLVLADRPDFVTLNEVYNRSATDLQPAGYAAWHPASPRDARDTAVLWRADTWTLADRGSVLMHARNVTWGTRYVSWVTLTAADGQTVSVISGHASPGGPGRGGLFAEFQTRLVELIEQLAATGPVLFGGDLNVQYPHAQPAQARAFEEPFRAVGAQTTFGALGEPVGGWATGTHNGGTIDYIIAADAIALRHATTTLRYSDHRMVSAELRLVDGDVPGSPVSLADVAGEAGNCTPFVLPTAGAVVYPVPANLASSNRNNWGGRGGNWSDWHTGTDFSVPCGTPVLASHAGTIEVDTSQSWAGAWLVKVTMGSGQLTTWYAHMQTVLVAPGQVVQPGQQIGEVGAEGNSTGCHLHFEVHLKNGAIYGPDNVDPTPWLAANVGRTIHGPAESVRVASFNVRGDDHTTPGGGNQHKVDAVTRMGWTVEALDSAGIEVVGLQEFWPTQHRAFLDKTAGTFAYYPAIRGGQRADNVVAWRTDRWVAVAVDSVQVPYPNGSEVAMPYVLLQHRATGQRVWVISVHNPDAGCAECGASQARAAAVKVAANLISRLAADGTPVILTGDMNDRRDFFCSITATAPVHAANGGSTGPSCAPPADMGMDWIMGSTAVSFTGYTSTRSGMIAHASDHPLIYADAAFR